jgi:MFS family permease
VLEASPFQVGLLMAATYAPLTLFGLFAGAWADRVRRRRLLVGADLLRSVVIASVPAAYALHALTLLHLYVVALVAGSLTVVFYVAHGSYLPALVDRELLVAANARLQVSEQGASVLGPAAGALLVTAVGAPLALILDAASFLGSAAFLMTSATARQRPHVPRKRRLASSRRSPPASAMSPRDPACARLPYPAPWPTCSCA